jgi:sulfur-oxidizing protein SoxX
MTLRLVGGMLLATIVSFAAPTASCAQIRSALEIPEPLVSQPGDAFRGRVIVLSRQSGLCILCHSGPFPEERFQGNMAPDLGVSAQRLTASQLRARIVDASVFNPETIMPAYYRSSGLSRVAPGYAGKTLLTGQEIEDVVAFLVSLKP